VQLNFNPPSDVNYPPRIKDYSPSAVDTVEVFAGVLKLFKVSAIDFNADEITYSWQLDQMPEPLAIGDTYAFNVADLGSGVYQLGVIVSDGQDSTQISWLIDYHTDHAIIDNEDFLMYSEQGIWELEWSSSFFKTYGPNCRYTLLSNIGDWAQFMYYPKLSGSYTLYEIIPQTINASNNALYCLFVDNLCIDSVYTDQNAGSGDWYKIGDYHFNSGEELRVRLINTGTATQGAVLIADAIKLEYDAGTGYITEEENGNPNEYILFPNYPNPFNPRTVISWQIGATHMSRIQVDLSIYNLLGQKVATLVSKRLAAGYYQVEWDASDIASGIYYYHLKAGAFQDVSKMVYIK
jgi:hypothetical protein